jgi:hypothetical protein
VTPRAATLWYACHEMERPNDPLITWHYVDCLGCAVKAAATMRRNPDDATVARVLGPIVERAGLL